QSTLPLARELRLRCSVPNLLTSDALRCAASNQRAPYALFRTRLCIPTPWLPHSTAPHGDPHQASGFPVHVEVRRAESCESYFHILGKEIQVKAKLTALFAV